MATSIDSVVEYDVGQATTHELFGVNFSGRSIETLVTHTPYMVDSWIAETEAIHSRRLCHLVVGLDIEWRPNNKYYTNRVATLQLCVGRRCLIFKLLHAPYVPNSLLAFLTNPDYTFVGVGISGDVEKLRADHGLEVSNMVDLRHLAAQQLGDRNLAKAGLKVLARVVLQEHLDKPKRVTLSRWDEMWLTREQVQYARLDAFVSFEVGRCLDAWSY